MRIAVAGGGRFGAGVFRALLESQHDVVALLQNGRKTKGYKRRIVPLLDAALARSASPAGMAARAGVRIVYIDKMTDSELAPLAALEPDLLVVSGFSIILKKPLLDLPRVGCINCHSSLLPKHRGPNPFSAVILAAAEESGVTYHIMTEGIDDGDIVAQFRFPLTEQDDAATVYQKACEMVRENIVSVVDGVAADGLHGTPQNPEESTYDKKLTEDQVTIDWRRPAQEIQRLVRAGYLVAPARFKWNGRTVFLWRAEFDATPVQARPATIAANTPNVVVATGKGTVRVLNAFVRRPFPWVWPPLSRRPKIGTILK